MDRVVLITGCSTGIGRQLSLNFSKRGFVVYATARKVTDIEDLKDLGIKTDTLNVDRIEEVQRVTNRIIEESGRIDILVNNAGYGLMGPVSDVPLQSVRDQFETNVVSLISVSQNVIPHMIREKKGTIVNIGSISGVLATPFSGIYCATKASVHSISDALRMELAPFNIRVLTVQAGSVKSNFGDNAEKKAEGVIKKRDSVYAPLADAIRKRASSSQINPTPVELFTDKLISEIISGRKEVFKMGKNTITMEFMAKWLPKRLSDKILMKKFSLDRI